MADELPRVTGDHAWCLHFRSTVYLKMTAYGGEYKLLNWQSRTARAMENGN
jgi:hypothetical protein